MNFRWLASTFQWPVSSERYQLAGRIGGHDGDAVNCLAINDQGTLLASGGDSCMKLWDLVTFAEVPSSVRRHAFCDPVSVAMWITRKEEDRETLCFGTGLGYLVFWRQIAKSKSIHFEEVVMRRVGSGGEITCMTSDTSVAAGVRIATGTRERHVMVWIFNNDILTPFLSVQLGTTVPKGIAFINGQKDMYVWGTYDGQIHTMREDGRIVKTTNLSTAIGGVAIHNKQSVFIIDNVTDGFSLHSVENGNLIRSYSTKPTKSKPKQVAFAERGAVIVGGGDSGSVYVFDRKQGALLQELHHNDEGLVQTIAVHDGETHTTIVAATSSNAAEVSMSIWRHQTPKPTNGSSTHTKSGESTFFQVIDTLARVLLRILVILVLVIVLLDHLNQDSLRSKWLKAQTSELMSILFKHTPPPAVVTKPRRAVWNGEDEVYQKYQASRQEWKRREARASKRDVVELRANAPTVTGTVGEDEAYQKYQVGRQREWKREQGEASEQENTDVVIYL